MLRLLALLTVLGLMPGMAQAGAWPRGEGKTFLSLSLAPTLDSVGGRGELLGWRGMFFERGLSDRLTLGLDADKRTKGDNNWQAMAFLRWDVSPGKDVKRSLGLGIGRHFFDGRHEMVVRPTFAIGKGFETPMGNGWMDAEAQAIYAPSSAWLAWKLDTTLGVSRGERQLYYVQVQSSLYPRRTTEVKLVPTFVQRLGRGASLTGALSAELGGDNQVELILGTWFEF